MTLALTGLGSGAVHALSGPDHLVSLAPLSVGRARGGWAVGLWWGVGHGLGTLAVGVVLLALASQLHIASAAAWAERAAGVALIAMGIHGLLRARAGAAVLAAGAARVLRRSLVGIGLLHGATGAAGLLLLLPAAAAAAPLAQAAYLGGFTAGSTLAMAALTAALAGASRWPFAAAAVRWAPRASSVAAVALGVAWILAA